MSIRLGRRVFQFALLGLPLVGAGIASRAAAQASPRSVATARIVFQNRGSAPLLTVWLDFSGNEVIYATVAPGASVTQETYVGHIWRFRRGAGGPVITQWTCDRAAGTVIVGDGGYNVI